MGDVTSTCCQNTSHLQQANLTRQINVQSNQQVQVQVLTQQPFQQAPQSIKETLRQAARTTFFKQPDSMIPFQNDSQVWNAEHITTIKRKNKNTGNEDGSIFSFISSSSLLGEYSTYVKSLNQNKIGKNNDSNYDNNTKLTGLFFIYFPNKQYFLGHLVENSPSNGIFVFKPGCYYVGNIRDLQAQGQGRYQNQQNCYIYQGSWSKNMEHGKGQQFYQQNGDVFEGQFMYGSKFGQGVYKFKDGRVYEGYFYNGLSDGIGKLTISKKQWYKGQWKLGSIQGNGQYHYQNGDIYYGQFDNGMKSGQGRYLFAAGYEYNGDWNDGKMHGRGLIKQGYDQIEGEWVQGTKVK